MRAFLFEKRGIFGEFKFISLLAVAKSLLDYSERSNSEDSNYCQSRVQLCSMMEGVLAKEDGMDMGLHQKVLEGNGCEACLRLLQAILNLMVRLRFTCEKFVEPVLNYL